MGHAFQFVLIFAVSFMAMLAVLTVREAALDRAEKPAICAGLNAHDCIAKLQGEPK